MLAVASASSFQCKYIAVGVGLECGDTFWVMLLFRLFCLYVLRGLNDTERDSLMTFSLDPFAVKNIFQGHVAREADVTRLHP